MRLDLPPGIELSAGRFTIITGPPQVHLQLLVTAASTRFLTLYLYGTTSRLLYRLPRGIREVEVQSCCTAHQLLQVIREVTATVLLVEYDEDLFSVLNDDQRPLIEQIGQALHDLAECSSALVVLSARGFDRSLNTIARYADCVVVYTGLPDEAAPGSVRAQTSPQRVPAQRTLAGGW
jgi:hypothetical protein